jgi:hypothetical protein
VPAQAKSRWVIKIINRIIGTNQNMSRNHKNSYNE